QRQQVAIRGKHGTRERGRQQRSIAERSRGGRFGSFLASIRKAPQLQGMTGAVDKDGRTARAEARSSHAFGEGQFLAGCRVPQVPLPVLPVRTVLREEEPAIGTVASEGVDRRLSE